MRPPSWAVWNQKRLNSCTSQVVCGAVELLQRKEKLHAPFEPSRLFLYYNELAMEGHTGHNDPVKMRDACKTAARSGVCREEQWPYVETKYITKPPTDAYTFADKHRVVRYYSLAPDLAHMKTCLADGYAFTIGVDVYPSYVSPDVWSTGKIPMPDSKNQPLIGRHALLVVGYDDDHDGGHFVVRNSAGKTWGKDGYGMLPYAFATDSKLSDSFWTIRFTE